MKKRTIVFATNNAHKLGELRGIAGEEWNIVSLAEIGCHDDIPETADTLEGNALIKARWVKERYGYDCFADDTGLMVVIALVMGGEEHIFEGRVDGTIAREPSGCGGFGYDPVFVPENSGRTFSEMSAEEKNAISHRGRATRKLMEFLARK